MRMGFWRTAALSGVLVLATAGCAGGAGPSVDAVDRGTIGIAMPTTTSPRWISDGANIERQLKLLGYKTDLRYAQDDPAKQASQLQDMVARHEKALVVASIDGTKLKDALQQAADAKIPVIAYDRLIRETPNIDYYATFDNFKVGVVQASAIVSALGLDKGEGPFTIELFAGSADDNNAIFFFNGSMSVLKPYLDGGKLIVRSGQTRFAAVATQRWDGKIAQARMAKVLATSYSSTRLNAVLSPYDGISRGILTALQAAGYGARTPLPVITGQDAELESVKLVATGKQTETVYKDTRELAKVAVQITHSLLTGGEPQVNDTTQYDNGVKKVPTFLLQPVGVDKSNYQRVLVGGGYYTDAQLAG